MVVDLVYSIECFVPGYVTRHCVVGSYAADFVLLGDFRLIDDVMGSILVD